MPLLPLVLNFLRKNWFPILVAIAIITAFLYVWNLHRTINNQQVVIVKLELNLNKCDTAIETQNRVIEGWSKKTLEQNAEMENLEQILKDTQVRNDNTIRNILNGYKPATCDEAINYLIDQGQEYAK